MIFLHDLHTAGLFICAFVVFCFLKFDFQDKQVELYSDNKCRTKKGLKYIKKYNFLSPPKNPNKKPQPNKKKILIS